MLLAAVMLLLPLPRAAAEPSAPVLRALLISVDEFISQPDTGSSSYNNIVAIRRALLGDARGYAKIRVSVNEALTFEGFQTLVNDAFRDAGTNDFSLVYLATHGLLDEDKGDFLGVMSDGTTENQLSGKQIQQALEQVSGNKLLILDACFSGAAIGKGMNEPLVSSAFAGGNIRVLTSAGGLEPSFLWTDNRGRIRGGSYFAQAMVDGISSAGRYQADINRDGQITLAELYEHQFQQYGASTPQVYPQNDDFPVFVYHQSQRTNLPRQVGDVSVENRVMSSDDEDLAFSYTLYEPAHIAYQLVYEKDENWRFAHPQNISEDGRQTPGRKEARLQLQPGIDSQNGYVLLFILTVYEDWSAPHTCLLLGVQTQKQDPELKVEASAAFTPSIGEEAAFILRHQGVVRYTAQILDERGQQVACLAYQRMSRPMHLQPEGTPIYWNGRDRGGKPAAPGRYRLAVTAQVAGREYYAASQLIELKDGGAKQ